jgi:DNA-directed RNA polymerase I subunit RPA12
MPAVDQKWRHYASPYNRGIASPLFIATIKKEHVLRISQKESQYRSETRSSCGDRMIIIMPWPFCPSCRATLKVDSSGDIDCVVCEYSNNLANLKELPSTTTYSSDRPVPLWAKSDEEQKALQRSSEPTRATVEEPCVKCGHGIVGFYTVQMRSVDEGQTVFYECPECKHTWSINN